MNISFVNYELVIARNIYCMLIFYEIKEMSFVFKTGVIIEAK